MANSNTVEIDGVGRVLFERSKWAKHVNISMKPFKGVRVAVPNGLSFKKAEEFVHTKIDWIQRHLVRMKQYEEESQFASDTSVDIDRVKAKRKLTRRLKHLALKHGFTYNRVFIRNQKTSSHLAKEYGYNPRGEREKWDWAEDGRTNGLCDSA